VLQGAVLVLGGIAFADMLCEGAAADWAAVYLRNSLHAVPLVAGLGYAAYALAMLTVRLSGNRIFTRFAAHRVLPLLAAMASLGFAAGLVIARPVSVLVGFALLGAGLGSVVPMILSAAGAVDNVDTGKAVAAVAGCGWAGYVVGPVVIGEIASTTTLHTALFLIPVLAGTVAVATGTAKALRRSALPADAAPISHSNSFGSRSSSPSSPIQRTPHAPSASTTGRSSSPAGVRTYCTLGPSVRRSTTPARTSCWSRLDSSVGDMRGTPRRNSLKCRLPVTSSRTMSNVQRSSSSSIALATGQN
jgi:MFS family permease